MHILSLDGDGDDGLPQYSGTQSGLSMHLNVFVYMHEPLQLHTNMQC